MASTQVQVGKLRPRSEEGCVSDTLEDLSLLGLWDPCDETQGLSREGP